MPREKEGMVAMSEEKQIAGKLKKLYEEGQYLELLSAANTALDGGMFSRELYLYAFRVLEKLQMAKPLVAMYCRAAQEFEQRELDFPTDEVQALFAWAAEQLGETETEIMMVKEDLYQATKKQKNMTGEPFFCGYEVFKHVYSIMARTAERTGQVISLILVHVCLPEGAVGEEAERLYARKVRSILSSGALRKSDVFTQYSNNKYIIALSTDRAIGASYVVQRLELRFIEELEETGASVSLTLSEVE